MPTFRNYNEFEKFLNSKLQKAMELTRDEVFEIVSGKVSDKVSRVSKVSKVSRVSRVSKVSKVSSFSRTSRTSRFSRTSRTSRISRTSRTSRALKRGAAVFVIVSVIVVCG